MKYTQRQESRARDLALEQAEQNWEDHAELNHEPADTYPTVKLEVRSYVELDGEVYEDFNEKEYDIDPSDIDLEDGFDPWETDDIMKRLKTEYMDNFQNEHWEEFVEKTPQQVMRDNLYQASVGYSNVFSVLRDRFQTAINDIGHYVSMPTPLFVRWDEPVPVEKITNQFEAFRQQTWDEVQQMLLRLDQLLEESKKMCENIEDVAITDTEEDE